MLHSQPIALALADCSDENVETNDDKEDRKQRIQRPNDYRSGVQNEHSNQQFDECVGSTQRLFLR